MNKKKNIAKDQEEENLTVSRDEQEKEILLRIQKKKTTITIIIMDEQEKELLLRTKNKRVNMDK